MLDFQDMRTVPGLQAADLLAWELRHVYHLKETRPDLGLRLPYRLLIEHQKWTHSQTLKFLPGWYIEFQVKGFHAAAMGVIMSDPERWRVLYDQLEAPGMDSRASTRMFGMLEKYVKYDGDPPEYLDAVMQPEPVLPGGVRLRK